MSEQEEPVYKITAQEWLVVLKDVYMQGLKDKEDAASVAFRDGFNSGFSMGQETKEKVFKTHEVG